MPMGCAASLKCSEGTMFAVSRTPRPLLLERQNGQINFEPRVQKSGANFDTDIFQGPWCTELARQQTEVRVEGGSLTHAHDQ